MNGKKVWNVVIEATVTQASERTMKRATEKTAKRKIQEIDCMHWRRHWVWAGDYYNAATVATLLLASVCWTNLFRPTFGVCSSHSIVASSQEHVLSFTAATLTRKHFLLHSFSFLPLFRAVFISAAYELHHHFRHQQHTLDVVLFTIILTTPKHCSFVRSLAPALVLRVVPLVIVFNELNDSWKSHAMKSSE